MPRGATGHKPIPRDVTGDSSAQFRTRLLVPAKRRAFAFSGKGKYINRLSGTIHVYFRKGSVSSPPGTFLPEPLSIESDWKKTIMNTSSAHHSIRHALFTALLAGIALSCLASCSKPAPETPMERSRVLLRLFSNMDRQENDEALINIETYRNLNPTNLFLSDFEHIVRANSVIASAKAKLEAGDIAGASADLDAYCLKYGDTSQSVTDAKAQVDILLEAQRLNERMLAAEFSEDLRAAAADMNEFAKTNSKLFPKLAAYASAKNKEADKLAVLEKADACAALLQDAMDAAAAGRKAEAASLIAILELNADAAQIAGFEAWLRRHPANP